MDMNVEKTAHEDSTSSQAAAHKLSSEAQHGHSKSGTGEKTSAENLADTKAAFAVVDELESRRIPGTSSFKCEGSHSNGYDAGVRWGGCLSDRNAYDGLWTVTGDKGSLVNRTLEQTKSDIKDDTWTKKEVVFGENGKDAIASRVTHIGHDHELSSKLNFESLGHNYSATTNGGKTEIRRLPDNADVANPDLSAKGTALTDQKSIEYRAALNKADKMEYTIQFLPIKDQLDNKAAVDDIAKKFDAGLTRQGAQELENQLVSIYKQPGDHHEVVEQQNEFLKDLAEKTKDGHGAKLHLNGEFDTGLTVGYWRGGVSIDPPPSAAEKHQPRFMVARQYDGNSDFIADEMKINEQALIKLNPRISGGVIPGMVIELP